MQLLPTWLRERRTVQYGALPYRTEADGSIGVMLVTSRSQRRWILPKGGRGCFLSPVRSAAREAYEEAGVRGEISGRSVGRYRHLKRDARRPLEVEIFPLRVTEELESWPERGERERRWFALADAAEAVGDVPLRALIARFEPPAWPDQRAAAKQAGVKGRGVDR